MCSIREVRSSFVVDEGDTIECQCEVTYRGRWAPIMEWTDTLGQTINSTDIGIPSQSVKHKITVMITDAYNGVRFICNTSFPNITQSETTSNIEYEYSYRTAALIVHCKLFIANLMQFKATYCSLA